MKTDASKTPELRALRTLARGQVHGGYRWAAVMSDGALICETCTRENYRQMFSSTRDGAGDGWDVEGLTHSGETESDEFCSNCNKLIFEVQS